MNPKELQNNSELFEYLAQLAKYLKNGGHPELAKAVNQAMQFASGSSSEFMHEAYLTLERVWTEQPKGLSTNQLQDVMAVLTQIKNAFRRIGGA